MRINLNLREYELPDGSTIEDLKREMNLSDTEVPVVVNNRIVEPSRHFNFHLKDGDYVETIR